MIKKDFKPCQPLKWSDFMGICKDYDADILHLTEETKGLKEMFEVLILIIYRQSGYEGSFDQWLEEAYKDLETLEDKIN